MSSVSVSAVFAVQENHKDTALPFPRPSHHLNDSASHFTNPWSSFRGFAMCVSIRDTFDANGMLAVQIKKAPVPPPVSKDIHNLVGMRTPDWGVNAPSDRIKATWLGHACFLLELPTPLGAARGPRILFDPVFSHRCSPFSWLGPGRYTKTPCSLTDIPEVDVIVISHNHYDHMDTGTLKALLIPESKGRSKSMPIPRIHTYAPLNNNAYFNSISIPSSHYHCLDWWDANDITVELPKTASPSSKESVSGTISATFRLTCTPAQHISGRGLLDRYTTLWSSWVVESSPRQSPGYINKESRAVKVWFGGDTGYRTVRSGEDESLLPVCPVFSEIGEKFGGFDLAFIPIGAYAPRATFSSVHCDPHDSVCIFKDIKAKRGIAMHWGTWILTTEEIMEPPTRLKEECAKEGLEVGIFDVCGMGETIVV
ncbi:beta-lactamase superfamily domain-containing protein [Hysterangium stoloniferum]|nr:beta-lactamase superfamily domain-containing protein [Hysterangium stoloniferum]